MLTLPVVTNKGTIKGVSVVFSFKSWRYSGEGEGNQLTHIWAKLNNTYIVVRIVIICFCLGISAYLKPFIHGLRPGISFDPSLCSGSNEMSGFKPSMARISNGN